MKDHANHSASLGIFGLFLAFIGEAAHYLCAGWKPNLQPIAQDFYYLCIAAALLLCSVSSYQRKEKGVIKAVCEFLIYIFAAKFIDELTHRATTFNDKEFWYIVAVILYVLVKSIKRIASEPLER